MMEMDSLMKPPWLKKKIDLEHLSSMDVLTSKLSLNTVCKEASCPNRSECHSNGIATFMILGSVCTRSCRFCDIDTGKPDVVNLNEPKHVAEAVKRLKLNHVVITSVARDDLPDQGAVQFVRTIEAIKCVAPSTTIEVLIPDFRGDPALLYTVLTAKPHIVNHNIETVARLQKKVRVQATYKRSLRVLQLLKQINPNVYVKSGIMVGLGESEEEIEQTIVDLHTIGCEMLTLGQYLRPSTKHLPVVRYVPVDDFKNYKAYAESIGFSFVASGPYVRSSYMAEELFNKDNKILQRALQ